MEEELINYLTENPGAVDTLNDETVERLIAYLTISIEQKEKLLAELKNQ